MNSNKKAHNHTSSKAKSFPIYFCTPKQASTLLSEGRTLLLFVRHGLTDWNVEMRLQGREDIPLNFEGKIQAEEIATIMDAALSKKTKINGVYTSPLTRAKDTAAYISQRLDLDYPTSLDGLIERDYSELSGLTLAERKALYATPKDYPGSMEGVYSAATRMKRVALELCENGKVSDGATICVTHGGVINALFSYLTKGRAGTCKNIARNCSISAVASCTTDIIPLFFNLCGEEFVSYINELNI